MAGAGNEGKILRCILDFRMNTFKICDAEGNIMTSSSNFQIQGRSFRAFIFLYGHGLRACSVLKSESLVV